MVLHVLYQIDDVTIFGQCSIMDHVNEGDAFLVDRGFTIQDILLRKQATIFIPLFLKGRVDSHKAHPESSDSCGKVQ